MAPRTKPTKLKQLEGNPGKRPLPDREPQPKGEPVKPDWITGAAETEWDRITGEMRAMRLLTGVDSAALAGYCQSYARWREAEEIVKADGPVIEYTNKAGATNKTAHPMINVALKYLGAMRVFCAEFGLTPSARTKLTVPEDDNSDSELEALVR